VHRPMRQWPVIRLRWSVGIRLTVLRCALLALGQCSSDGVRTKFRVRRLLDTFGLLCRCSSRGPNCARREQRAEATG
jgi:hypothetical protein